MIIDIIYNIALLLTLSVIYAIFPLASSPSQKAHTIPKGIIIGITGLLIMSRPFILFEGIVFDSRSILIGASAMFFGPVPAIISSAMMAAFRINMGGGGVYTGLSVIASSCLIGSLWHKRRLHLVLKKNRELGIEFYLVGLCIHCVMVLLLVLMPKGQINEILRTMAFPILVVYPIGFYLLSMLLYSQIQRSTTAKQLAQSEKRFKIMFEKAPMGITFSESISGKIVDVNQRFLDILQMDKHMACSCDWKTITHPDDLDADLRMMQKLLRSEISSYSMDKRLRRPDGIYVWVNIAIASLSIENDQVRYHLCMVTDITDRKESERALVYAHSHDNLTNLYNRSHFEQYVRTVDIPENIPLSISIGDINGLKLINDAFGRREGDLLLKRVAATILSMLKEGDYCARIGGDEIAIVMPKTPLDEAISRIGEIQKQLAMHTVRNVEVSLSFGTGAKTHELYDMNELLTFVENDMNRSKLYEKK